jgi:hypothetical protein
MEPNKVVLPAGVQANEHVIPQGVGELVLKMTAPAVAAELKLVPAETPVVQLPEI